MGAVLSTVAGDPCSILSPVPSATLLYCADMRLTLREWLDTLIGRDILSEKSVKTEATRLLPSRPRASRRIGTSSEALCAGNRVNRRIGNSSEALWGGASGERALERGPRRGGELAFHLRPLRCGP